MKKYKCVEDLQSGDWCVGIIETTEERRDRFIGFCEMEDREVALEALKVLKDDELMDYISDYWQLRFEEVN